MRRAALLPLLLGATVLFAGCLVDPAARAPRREPRRIPALGPQGTAPAAASTPGTRPEPVAAAEPVAEPEPLSPSDPSTAADRPSEASLAAVPEPAIESAIEPAVERAPVSTAPAPVSSPPAASPVLDGYDDFDGGTDLVADGRRIPVGRRVVHWSEAPYYDAYRPHPRFGDASEDSPTGPRFRVEGREDEVELFVLHYDACGTSRRCFEVLQDLRGLSVHFLLDVDGTIYQTLDCAEQAWHASQANARSVGVEIANVGAHPAGELDVLGDWYDEDGDGLRLTIPERYRGELPADLELRPRRHHLVPGAIHGRPLVQADFTDAQYAALVDLTVALIRAYPAITPDAPRDEHGRVRTDALSDEELARFRGILGHSHVTTRKVDPGPAFDWERYLAAVRAGLAAVSPESRSE